MKSELLKQIGIRATTKLDLKSLTAEHAIYAVLDRAALWDEYQRTRYVRRVLVILTRWTIWAPLLFGAVVVGLKLATILPLPWLWVAILLLPSILPVSVALFVIEWMHSAHHEALSAYNDQLAQAAPPADAAQAASLLAAITKVAAQ